jgi:hypothetical protein
MDSALDSIERPRTTAERSAPRPLAPDQLDARRAAVEEPRKRRNSAVARDESLARRAQPHLDHHRPVLDAEAPDALLGREPPVSGDQPERRPTPRAAFSCMLSSIAMIAGRLGARCARRNSRGERGTARASSRDHTPQAPDHRPLRNGRTSLALAASGFWRISNDSPTKTDIPSLSPPQCHLQLAPATLPDKRGQAV